MLFTIIMMGVPVVLPSNTPDRMRTWSGSLRWVVYLLCPGRRLSMKTWILASVSGIPGGVPSTTQPMAGPWLSPKVVNRKRCPKVLKLMTGRTLADPSLQC